MSKEVHFRHPEFARVWHTTCFPSIFGTPSEGVPHAPPRNYYKSKCPLYADNDKIIKPFPKNVIHESKMWWVRW
jgi:hypothetical protein